MVRKRLFLVFGSLLLIFGLGVTAAPAALAADDDVYTPISVDVEGSTHIGAGVNADAKLGPATMKAQFGIINGGIKDGVLALPPTKVQFKALGVIPIRSTTSFIAAAPITGKLTSAAVNTVTTQASYYIRLSDMEVNVLGLWIPLFVGDNCRTIDPVQLNLQTPPGQSFDLNTGGTVSGKYTIGLFQNCAPLHLPDIFGVGSLTVNALVPGSNNTASLNLTNFTFL